MLFFVIHVVQVTLAGWNNFRSVISGFEVVEVPPPAVLEISAEETNTLADQDHITGQGMDNEGHLPMDIQ